MDDAEYIEEYISSMLTGLADASINVGKPERQFRASGLPFCPILSFLREDNHETYTKSFYTSIGTAMHETIQSWLAYSGHSAKDMYGCWECTGCGKVVENRKQPKKPCGCHHKVSTTYYHRNWPKFWNYKEVTVEYKGLSGHIDLILIPKPEFVIVVDFKSTALESKKTSGWGWEDNKPATLSYVTQIRTYCSLLETLHGLKVRGWALVMLDRNKPIQKAADLHTIPGTWNPNKTKRWLRLIDRASRGNKLLTRLEEKVDEGDREIARRLMKAIIKERPCQSDADYNRFMAYKFYKSECELKGVCCNGKEGETRDKKVFKAVQEKLRSLN